MSKILNEPAWTSLYLKNQDLSEAFRDALAGVINTFYNKERNEMNYAVMIDHEEYGDLCRLARALPHIDINTLASQEARLGFWLNVYNFLAIHIVVANRLTKGPTQVDGFFSNFQYRIGKELFSLDDIEHGVLRCNNKRYLGLSSHFSKGDSRIDRVLDSLDPRIHFAFACCTRSSPPPKVFYADSLDQHLDNATEEYLEQHLSYDADRKRLTIPKLFKWYGKDFGGEKEIMAFIAKHTRNAELKAHLSAGDKVKLNFHEYDWALNASSNVSGSVAEAQS